MIAAPGKRLAMGASTRLWWGSPRTVFVDATEPGLTLRLPPADSVPPGTVFNLVIVGDEAVTIADATGATLVAAAATGTRVRVVLRADLTWASY